MKRKVGRPPLNNPLNEEKPQRITDQVGPMGRQTQRVIDVTCKTWCIAKALDRFRYILAKGKMDKIVKIDIDTMIVLLAVASIDLDRIDNGHIMPDGKRYISNPPSFSRKEFHTCFNLNDPGKENSKFQKKFNQDIDFLIEEGLIWEVPYFSEEFQEEVPVLRVTEYGDDAIFNLNTDMMRDWPQDGINETHIEVAEYIIAGKPYGKIVPDGYGDVNPKW